MLLRSVMVQSSMRDNGLPLNFRYDMLKEDDTPAARLEQHTSSRCLSRGLAQRPAHSRHPYSAENVDDLLLHELISYLDPSNEVQSIGLFLSVVSEVNACIASIRTIGSKH